jgi:hypothetical protein
MFKRLRRNSRGLFQNTTLLSAAKSEPYITVHLRHNKDFNPPFLNFLCVCQKNSIFICLQFLKSSVLEEYICLFRLVSCLTYSSALNMEAIYSSETSGCLVTTRWYNPEDCSFRSHHREIKKTQTKTISLVYRLIFVQALQMLCHFENYNQFSFI